jgi:hypothetical protein
MRSRQCRGARKLFILTEENCAGATATPKNYKVAVARQ